MSYRQRDRETCTRSTALRDASASTKNKQSADLVGLGAVISQSLKSFDYPRVKNKILPIRIGSNHSLILPLDEIQEIKYL